MIRCVAERHARFQIEEQSHTSKLIQVVHRLRAKSRFPGDQLAEWYQSLPIIRSDVEPRQVFGVRARGVFHFQDDLILILRFLDQVQVVLRIGIAQERQNPRLRHAVGLSLIATKLNVEIGSVVVEVR